MHGETSLYLHGARMFLQNTTQAVYWSGGRLSLGGERDQVETDSARAVPAAKGEGCNQKPFFWGGGKGFLTGLFVKFVTLAVCGATACPLAKLHVADVNDVRSTVHFVLTSAAPTRPELSENGYYVRSWLRLTRWRCCRDQRASSVRSVRPRWELCWWRGRSSIRRRSYHGWARGEHEGKAPCFVAVRRAVGLLRDANCSIPPKRAAARRRTPFDRKTVERGGHLAGLFASGRATSYRDVNPPRGIGRCSPGKLATPTWPESYKPARFADKRGARGRRHARARWAE